MHVLNLHNADWSLEVHVLQVVKVYIWQYTREFNFDNRKVHEHFFPRIYDSPIGNRFYEHSTVRLNNKPIMSDSI